MAWQQQQALKCPGCGYPRDLTTGRIRPNRFKAEPVVCHVDMALDDARRAWRKNHPDTALPQMRVIDRQGEL